MHQKLSLWPLLSDIWSMLHFRWNRKFWTFGRDLSKMWCIQWCRHDTNTHKCCKQRPEAFKTRLLSVFMTLDASRSAQVHLSKIFNFGCESPNESHGTFILKVVTAGNDILKVVSAISILSFRMSIRRNDVQNEWNDHYDLRIETSNGCYVSEKII